MPMAYCLWIAFYLR